MQQVNENTRGAQSSDDLGKHPSAIRVRASLVRGVEVDAVETGDGDGEHELEDAQDEADTGADAMRIVCRVVANVG